MSQFSLPFHPDKKIEGRFDGGSLTSDAGLLVLYALDQQQGLSSGLADCIRDGRDPRYVRHSFQEMICQRVHQIAAGYEDCNDANSLRQDPVFKTLCGRNPETDPDLASQPTLSRLENAVSPRDLMRISRWLLEHYLKRRKKTRPKKLLLDLDSTDDPTHGQQEFTFFHGYFGSYIYHPLLVFDGETGDLVAALLRPGNQGAARHSVALLRRLVKRIRQVLGAQIQIEIRADSGFATPEIYEYCEQEGLTFTLGLARNPRLEAAIQDQVDQSRQAFDREQKNQRDFTDFFYQAKTWDRSRRVVAKVEVNALGVNRRFVITNRHNFTPAQLYNRYTDRGQTENYIKALKNDLAMDRLSCHRFLANQFRLLLHACAYQLFLRLRDYLWGTPWRDLQIETLRRRLLKIGARVKETSRRIWVHLASSYPEQDLFTVLLRRLCPT